MVISVLEPTAIVAGLDNVAVTGQSVEQPWSSFGTREDLVHSANGWWR